VTNFQIAGVEEKVASISDTSRVNVESSSVKVEITKDVSKRELKVLDKRATVSCSSSSQKSFITSSQTEGKSLASIASSYIGTRGASDSLYKAYWGSTSTSTIRGVFNVSPQPLQYRIRVLFWLGCCKRELCLSHSQLL
jgi:deuterolysin